MTKKTKHHKKSPTPPPTPPPPPPQQTEEEKARDFVNQYHQPIPYEKSHVRLYARNTLESIEKLFLPTIKYETSILDLKTVGQHLPIFNPIVQIPWLYIYEKPLPTKCMIPTRKHDFAAVEQIGRRSYKWMDNAGTYFVKFESFERFQGKGPTLHREIEFLRNAAERNEHRSHFLDIIYVNKFLKGKYFMLHVAWCDTLEDVMRNVGGVFSQPTSLYIAAQTLEAVHDVHKHGYIHCEVCPTNFLVGLNDNHRTIYIINFQVAYKFANDDYPAKTPPPSWKQHMKYTTKAITYASRDYHMKNDRSPMNDLESWLYTVMYCFNPGFLPWKDDWNRARDETTPLYTASEHAKSERIIFEKKNHFFNLGYQQDWGVLKPYIAAIVNYIESPLFEIIKKVDFTFVMTKIHEIARKIKADFYAPLDWEPSSDGKTNQMRQLMFDARRKEKMEIAKKRFELKPSTGKSPQKQLRKASSVQRTQDEDENNNVFVSVVSKKSNAKGKSKVGNKQPRKASSVQRTQDEDEKNDVDAESELNKKLSKVPKVSKVSKDKKAMAAEQTQDEDGYQGFDADPNQKESKASKKPKKTMAAEVEEYANFTSKRDIVQPESSKKETTESSKNENSNVQKAKQRHDDSTPKETSLKNKKHAPVVVAKPAQAPDESKTPAETPTKLVTASEKKDVKMEEKSTNEMKKN